MTRSAFILTSIALTAALASCSDDSPTPPDPSSPPHGLRPGDLVWSLDLSRNPFAGTTPPAGISWTPDAGDGHPAIAVDADATGKGWSAKIAFDATPYEGMQVSLDCDIMVDSVTKPTASFAGAIIQVYLNSAAKGKSWAGKSGVYGTTGWRTYHTVIDIPKDLTESALWVGFTDCKGRAWMRNIHFTLVRDAVVRPLVDSSPIPRTHTPMRGIMGRYTWFSTDYAILRSWNANLVSWQLTGSQVSATSSDSFFHAWVSTNLVHLDTALATARRNGLKVNVVMQAPLGGRDSLNAANVYSDAGLQKRFVEMWTTIASHCADHAEAIYAYDLLSEPVQTGIVPAGLLDWRELQVATAKAIRAVDPRTAILIQVDQYDGDGPYKWMTPIDLPNLIYEVHMYTPHAFTHQGIYRPWGDSGGDPVVSYPGTFGTTTLDKNYLRESLGNVRAFQLAYRVPIFVGEFSAARWAPGADRYLADVTDLFEEYGWDWTYYTFREASVWDLETADTPYGLALLPVPNGQTARQRVILAQFAKNLSPY